MRKKLAMLFALSFLICSCSQGDSISESIAATSPTDMSTQFIGTWSLDSFTDKNEQGDTIHRYGEDAFGRIVYVANGKMMVILMRSGRESQLDPEFFSYTGTYAIDEAAGTVTHHIEACIAPDWIGTDRVRQFELLSENRIALRPVEGTSELIWNREN